jgi:DNA polymerase I-like protein with 3'-5' exonuclease and polymerase domains
MKYNPRFEEAYQLLHDGILALSNAEQHGMRVDTEYLERKMRVLTKRIDKLEKEFRQTNFFRHWQHSTKGTINIYSNVQLATFLYKVKKIKIEKETTSGQGATDDEALRQMNIPELNDLLQIRKFRKVRDTYLSAFQREQVNGYIHPFFNLHLVTTYRSCIAKGSLILAVRDFIKYPKGIPIEKIQEGDFIYCFDNKLNPSIQKVLWAGKTGHREVIRVHYTEKGGGGQGFLDITPEHKIRLIDGSYEEAQNLIGDFRKPGDGIRLAKIRTLSCKRTGDQLRFTGHLRWGCGILESHLIYEKFNGPLLEGEIVHHKDEIHLNHSPNNLEKTNYSKHGKHHVKNTLLTILARKNNLKAIQKAKEEGVYKRCHKRGLQSPNALKLSKFNCLRILAERKGKFTKVPYDFNTFKNYLQLHNIDPWKVKLRYSNNGKYIWKSYLSEISLLGRAKVEKLVGGINYYNLIKLYKEYNINTTRKWANQFGEFKPGNHIITKIEWIKKAVDVYDIKTEKYHNFFANELCVHNSSDHPNFQNIPKRDEELMQICRKALYPRPGHQLLEIDYSGLEVRIAACYHKDTTMLAYINDPKSDMHTDMAKQIFKMPKFDRSIPSHDILRYAAKNGFVFPEFYGDYYKNCAISLACTWGKLPQGKWKYGDGMVLDYGTLGNHLIDNGIKSLDAFIEHVKKIETDFWERRFPEYAEWKDRWYNAYRKNGYIDLLTGFRCSGIMGRNDCINYPVQGAAFHCLLWSFIRLDELLSSEKLDSHLVGQIHDSILIDVSPDELEYVAEMAHKITCFELPEVWKWIITSLDIEMEVCGVDESWAEKKKYEFK